MLANTLFVRVVNQDKDRGYMLLAGYDSGVVQRTCLSYTTLNVVTRESLNKAIQRMKENHSAAEVKDCTAPNIQKKLAKMFGEYPSNAPAAAQAAPAGIQLFGEMRIGQYL